MNSMITSISVFLLTALVTAGSVLMVGPQIIIIVPVAMTAGVIFAIKRSFIALVCLGYPLTFGLVSAFIGCTEIKDYTGTTAFAVSLGIGLVGVAMIAIGLWRTLGKTRPVSA